MKRRDVASLPSNCVTYVGDCLQRETKYLETREPKHGHQEGHMLFFTHTDVPGIIGRVGTVFGQHQVNIGQMSVGRATQQPGGHAIGVLNLDGVPPKVALDQLMAISAIEKVQMVELPALGVMPDWLS